jgi:redox-sensing transcriptional repressor
VKQFTSDPLAVPKHIADSTVRRLSLYLRFVEEALGRGLHTISSDALAALGGTTSAQVRKDLSFFGSFGKRGLGYPLPELVARLRDILGLEREWRVVIVGAGRIGSALAHYPGFSQHGFRVIGVYDNDADKIGRSWDGHPIRDVAHLARDAAREKPDIAVLAIPSDTAQATADLVVKAGIRAILNFAPTPLRVLDAVTVRTVNMALELEGLSYALAHKR